MNPIQRALRRILAVEMAHPVLTLLVAVTLAGLSILYTARNLGFLTGQTDLISPENRLMRLSENIDQFDKLDNFVIAIENRDTARSLRFLHALVPRLEADKAHFLQVFYRVDPEPLKPWSLLYLDKEDLFTLQDNLHEHQAFMQNLARSPRLTTFFKEVNQEMTSRMVGELFTGFLDEPSPDTDKEPLDLDFLIRVLRGMKQWLSGDTSFVSPWGSFFTKTSWGDQSEDSYFWTDHKGYLLVFITPKKADESFADALDSLKALRKTITAVRADFPGIRVGVTGQEALNEDEMGTALRDMSLATILSLASLAILLFLFWRGVRRPLLEIIELLIALSWTFGLTTLFIGHLNILSVTFAPLLLGLGIDYGIHWFARYQEEERLSRASRSEVIQTTMTRLGPGILLAGVTAALSFFPLVLTGFRGLVELGVITSMGMLMTTITTLGVLPALTLLFDKPGSGVREAERNKGSGHLFKLTHGRALAILIFAAIGLGFSAWGAGKVDFDLNMLHLQSKRAESVVWEKKLMQGSGRSSMYGAVMARSLDEVREKTKALEALRTVSEVQSVWSLLPENQEEKIAILKTLKPLLAGMETLRIPGGAVDLSELEKTLARIRFKMLDSSTSQWGAGKPLERQMIEVRTLIGQLRERFHSMDGSRLQQALRTFEHALILDLEDKINTLRANVNARPMQLQDLPPRLLQRFVSQDRLSYLIRVFPAQDIWEPELLGAFVRDMQSVDADAIGDPVTLYVFTQAFRDACIKAAGYAVIFIFLVLLITYRKFAHALLIMTPLIVGTLWTLGLMHVFGVDFNLANSIFLPLVVGAGVEYGIIILQRWRQQGGVSKGDVTVPFSTAKGVILAGLTTTVGFGSLAISDHQGIRSLGLLAMVGSLCILAAAILFLPALLQMWVAFSKNKQARSTSNLSIKEKAKL